MSLYWIFGRLFLRRTTVGLVALFGICFQGLIACTPALPEVADAGDPTAEPSTAESCYGLPDDVCRRNIDCKAGATCVRASEEEELGCCLQASCLQDRPCSCGGGSTGECDVRRGICECSPECSSLTEEEDCPIGLRCLNGRCVFLDPIQEAEKCALDREVIALRDGESIVLKGIGTLAAGPIVPHAAFFYEASMGAIDEGRWTAECAGPELCRGTLTVLNASRAVCGEVPLIAYPVIAAGDVRVVLLDAQTGAAAAGTVVLQLRNAQGDTSDLVQEVGANTGGTALFTDVAWAEVSSVSAFSMDHSWVTYLEPKPLSLAGPLDVVMRLESIPEAGKVAGVKGQINYDNVHTQGDVKIAFAGTALPFEMQDFTLNALIGPSEKHLINIEGVTQGPTLMDLPNQLTLGMANEDMKETFVAQAKPGPNMVWAMGGKVRLADIGPILSTLESEPLSKGSLLNSMLPFLSTFDHGLHVLRDDLIAQDVPEADVDGGSPRYDDGNMPALEGAEALELQVLTGLNALLDVPKLPCKSGQQVGGSCSGYREGMWTMLGIEVPGRGFVPLGFSVALDDPDDLGLSDGIVESEAGQGLVIVDFAPPHEGLEGLPMVTYAFATDFSTGSELHKAGIRLAGFPQANGSAPASFPAAFLQHPGGLFESGEAVKRFQQSDESTLENSADFYRLKLSDERGSWQIYYEGTAAQVEPLDLTALRPVAWSGRDDSLEIHAFKLDPNGAQANRGFAGLLDFSGQDPSQLSALLAGWSSTVCSARSGREERPLCEQVSE